MQFSEQKKQRARIAGHAYALAGALLECGYQTNVMWDENNKNRMLVVLATAERFRISVDGSDIPYWCWDLAGKENDPGWVESIDGAIEVVKTRWALSPDIEEEEHPTISIPNSIWELRWEDDGYQLFGGGPRIGLNAIEELIDLLNHFRDQMENRNEDGEGIIGQDITELDEDIYDISGEDEGWTQYKIVFADGSSTLKYINDDHDLHAELASVAEAEGEEIVTISMVQ